MNVADSIDISTMTTVEKLGLMERLWIDIAKRPEDIEVPQWHLKKLEEAEMRLARGEDEFVDFDVFEAELREKIRQRESR